MKGIFILLLIFLLPVTPSLAEKFTLEQAIDRALQLDPRIQERKHNVAAARALLQEALGSDDVFIDANAFMGIVPGVKGGLYQNGANTCVSPCTLRRDVYDFNDGLSLWTSVQIKLIKPLYTFGKVSNYAEAAQGNIDVKRGDVSLQRNQTRLDVATAYYGYLAARDTRYLLQDVSDRLDKALVLVNTWLDSDSGQVKQSDKFALETGVATLNRYLAEAQAVENIAMSGLHMLLGVAHDEPVELVDRKIRPLPLPEMDLDELRDKALIQRPEIDQLKAGLRARRALVLAKKADKMPNIYTGIIASVAVASNRDELKNPYVIDPFNHYAATPVLGLKWDWSDGVQSAKVARAQAELDALIAKRAYARVGIPFEVEEQYYQVLAHYRAVEEMSLASRAGRRWMISSYSDFEAGFEESTKVIEAFKSYVLAHSEYLKMVNDYNMYVLRLDNVTGVRH